LVSTFGVISQPTATRGLMTMKEDSTQFTEMLYKKLKQNKSRLIIQERTSLNKWGKIKDLEFQQQQKKKY